MQRKSSSSASMVWIPISSSGTGGRCPIWTGSALRAISSACEQPRPRKVQWRGRPLSPAWTRSRTAFSISFTAIRQRCSFSLSKAHVTTLRKGKAFWELLDSDGIPVTVIRIPANYPPIEAGEELAGMGTPDLRGTLGTFTFYTDDPEEISRPVSGGRIVKLSAFGNHVVLRVEGPPNSLRKGQPFA